MLSLAVSDLSDLISWPKKALMVSGNLPHVICHNFTEFIIVCIFYCVYKTDAYWTVIMLASTAESTLSSSRSAATDPSLSESSAGRMGTSAGTGPHAPGVSTGTALGLGTKKAEETRAELRRRLSSSSRCFFSCRMVARSSDRVSIRPEGEKQADHSTNIITTTVDSQATKSSTGNKAAVLFFKNVLLSFSCCTVTFFSFSLSSLMICSFLSFSRVSTVLKFVWKQKKKLIFSAYFVV